MLTHVLRITTATAVVMLCTLLPFLPGEYDSLATTLSRMAQLVGTVGLLFVPIGALWMAASHSRRFAGKQYAFALTTVVVSTRVWLTVALGAFVSGGLSLAVVRRQVRRARLRTKRPS